MVDAVGTVIKIVEVALKIKNAADKVKQNEDICQQIKGRVEILSNTLSKYQNNTELMNSLAVRAALEALGEILGEALKLVTDCQLKGMAERLPGQVAENGKLPLLPGIPLPSDISAIVTESLGSPESSGVQEQTSDSPNGLLVSDESSSATNKASHTEITNNGSTPTDAESHHEAEWVEKPEPDIYITLTGLPGGTNDLKRVQFSRKRYSVTQAEQWWQGNRARVYQQYNIHRV